MDPEAFRASLNTLIQDLRNVTWLLQKRKHELADFETWYPAWRQSVADDQVLDWVIEARNRIVKEADLDLHSRAVVRLWREKAGEIEDDLDLPARFTTHKIIAGLLAGIPRDRQHGVMTIERRWVDRALPAFELLEATAHAYEQLLDVVNRAHAAAGAQGCDLPARTRECVTAELSPGLPCMAFADDSRRLQVDIGSMRQRGEHQDFIRQDESLLAIGRQHYGNFKAHAGDAIARVLYATGMAKRMLAADKSLATVAWLTCGEQVLDGMMLMCGDQAGLSDGIHRLANRVELIGADGILFHGEAWYGHGPDAGEAIWVIGMTDDGRVAQSVTPFSRNANGDIIFGPPRHTRGGTVNMMEPITKTWRRMAERAAK